jgi:hypothetical protein
MDTSKRERIQYLKPSIVDLGEVDPTYGANCTPGSSATGGGDCETGTYANNCTINGTDASSSY